MTRNLMISEHARNRMCQRAILVSDLDRMLRDPCVRRRPTYRGRYVWSLRGVNIVIDEASGVVVTVTETEHRRTTQYQARRIGMTRIHYPPGGVRQGVAPPYGAVE